MKKYSIILLSICISLCKAQDSIVNIYQGLPIQLLDRLDTMQALIEKCSCKGYSSGDITPNMQNDFVQTACATAEPAVIAPGVFALDGSQNGSSPASGFCRVYVTDSLEATSYNISADLYNVASQEGPNYGHLGIFFNAKDINNFDLVYLRQHSASICYQTGKVINGALNWQGAVSAACANGVPPGGRWYNMKVAVNGNRTQIYRDGVLIVSTTAHFDPRGSGGVLVANGYKNLGLVRHMRIVKS